MTTKSEYLAACDELKIYKHEDEDFDIELKQSSEEVKELLHKDLLSNYVRPQLFGNHFFFNNAFGNYNNNFYRNNYHTTTTSASSFPNCAANSLTAAEIKTCPTFQPLANSFNQSKFHHDFINKHSSSINSFSPPTLSSNLSSTTNLTNKSQDSPLITNSNLANSLTAAEIRTSSSFQPLANSFNQSKFHNDFINKHSSSINSFNPPTLSSNLSSTANFTNKSPSSPLITSANLAALSHAAHLYSNTFYEQYGSVMNLAAMSKLHQQQSFVDAIYNCGFNSNSMLSVCPPQSSSANSAANALSAFSLTDTDLKPYYSPTANSHSSSVNRTSPNKSTDYNKLNGNAMNSITSSSKRTSTPVSSNSSSLTSPLMNDFNTLNQMPFNQINQHISQHLNHRLSQHLHGFDVDYAKRNFLDPVHHNPLSQSSSANLNTSNSDSLGSLNDSTGDLSDSMSKSISNSVNQDNTDHNQPHIKKPLNAFMLFMKDNRPHVLAESTLKESAAINKKLGEMWRSLSHKEQEKYIEKAKDLRELHFKLHPNWTAKNNYAINIRKKKRKKEKSTQMRQFQEYTNSGLLKKCRARYTVTQRDKWCKPCLRKKKCEKFKDNPASS